MCASECDVCATAIEYIRGYTTHTHTTHIYSMPMHACVINSLYIIIDSAIGDNRRIRLNI